MIALNNNDLRNCKPGKRENMLGFKRILADSWQSVFRIACIVLMQATCNSDFLVMGEEMHYILFIPVPAFPLSLGPVFPGSRAFPFIRFNRWPYGREPARWPA
jgi:hypothetical protein